MAQYFKIHPENPQKRLLDQAVKILSDGGVIAYPTDSCYALGCLLDHQAALQRIMRIRNLQASHLFTIICADLSELGSLARIDNSAFRLIKSLTPGPYTFILKASRDVPRRLQNPRRKTIGLRVPDNTICQGLLRALGQPMLSTSLIIPGHDTPETEPEIIRDKLGNMIDLIIDGGMIGNDLTTVIDLSDGVPELIRQGKGAIDL